MQDAAGNAIELAEKATQRNEELEAELCGYRQRAEDIQRYKSRNEELLSIIKHALDDLERSGMGISRALRDRVRRHAKDALYDHVRGADQNSSPDTQSLTTVSSRGSQRCQSSQCCRSSWSPCNDAGVLGSSDTATSHSSCCLSKPSSGSRSDSLSLATTAKRQRTDGHPASIDTTSSDSNSERLTFLQGCDGNAIEFQPSISHSGRSQGQHQTHAGPKPHVHAPATCFCGPHRQHQQKPGSSSFGSSHSLHTPSSINCGQSPGTSSNVHSLGTALGHDESLPWHGDAELSSAISYTQQNYSRPREAGNGACFPSDEPTMHVVNGKGLDSSGPIHSEGNALDEFIFDDNVSPTAFF